MGRYRRCSGAGDADGAREVRLALTFQSREIFVDRRRKEHVVGDAGDLLGVLPCGFENVKLALEGTSLGFLVHGHLERQASRRRQVVEETRSSVEQSLRL